MLNLLTPIDRYKEFLENEKHHLEERLHAMEEEKATLVRDFEKQYEEAVEDYEARIKQMEEEKKARNRENIENLQVLVKELTFIEEINETTKQELEKEREDNKKLREELQLAFKRIEDLEAKIQNQKETQTSSSGKDTLNETQVHTLQKKLKEEQQKMENIATLLSQLQSIVFSGSEKSKGDENVLNRLRMEQEAHEKTKQDLEDIKKKSAEDKQTISQLQKRIKDLIQSHSIALSQVGLVVILS